LGAGIENQKEEKRTKKYASVSLSRSGRLHLRWGMSSLPTFWDENVFLSLLLGQMRANWEE
jgi:hypothetical protein